MSLYIIKEITGQKLNAISHNDNFEDYTDFLGLDNALICASV